MKKRTRRILFWTAVVVFAAASYLVTRYAQGYRYDFEAGTFVRTGAIAITANTDAQLFIDDRLVGGLSFLGHRAGRDKLLPGSYTVRLVRDGWSAWDKEAIVGEGLLTDFPRVMVLPLDDESWPKLKEEFTEALKGALTRQATVVRVDGWSLTRGRLSLFDSPVAENVLGFSPTDNNDRVLWWTRNELWVQWVRDTDYQPYRQEGERELLSRWTVPIVRAAWFRDRDHIVVNLGPSGYRVIETDTRGGINIIRF